MVRGASGHALPRDFANPKLSVVVQLATLDCLLSLALVGLAPGYIKPVSKCVLEWRSVVDFAVDLTRYAVHGHCCWTPSDCRIR